MRDRLSIMVIIITIIIIFIIIIIMIIMIMGVSKSCKYKFTCEFTDYKICKFETSVNLHHQIPVICEVSDIINITNFITTQNPITKRKLLHWCKFVGLRSPPSLWGLVFSLLWGKICQWFGFPLTECLWQWWWLWWSWSCWHGPCRTGDDCVRNNYQETKYWLVFCPEYHQWWFIILGEASYIWVWRRQYWHFSGCIFITFTFQ